MAEYGSLDFAEQIDFFRAKINLPTRAWTDLWEGMHSKAFVVAGAMRDELLADLRRAVDAAIAEGETLERFRKRFDDIVARYGWQYKGGRNWRTRVIYDTNLRTSYQAGRYRQMKQIASRRPYWRYRHNDNVRHPRLQHKAWDGVILRHDDPWWRTHFPPNGWGCRCYIESLSERDLKRLGKDVPDPAPPIQWETVTVGQRGPSPRTVRVPKGIDPGWGYNVGEAAWGKPLAEQAALEAGARGWETLTAKTWRDWGRPKEIPVFQPMHQLGPKLTEPAAIIQAIEGIIGGQERVFTLESGGFRYPMLVNAEVLGEHIAKDPNRTPFLPLLAELLENPYEAWLTFERSRKSGKIALRLRLIRVVRFEKDRALVAVMNAQRGVLTGWTFIPYDLKRLNRLRQGWLVYHE